MELKSKNINAGLSKILIQTLEQEEENAACLQPGQTTLSVTKREPPG